MRLAYSGIAMVFAIVCLAAPTNGFAQRSSAQSTQPSLVAPSVREALTYLVGRWEITATDPKTGTTSRIIYSVQPFVRDTWISGAGKSEELGFESKDIWGKDPVSGEVIRTIFDSSGTYAVVRSPGWKNGTLVLEGDARLANGAVRVRETIRRINADEFEATWEAHRNGAWSAYSIERATRLPGKNSGGSRGARGRSSNQ